MSRFKEFTRKKIKEKDDPSLQESLTQEDQEGVSMSPPSFQLEVGKEKEASGNSIQTTPFQMKKSRGEESVQEKKDAYQLKLDPGAAHDVGCGCSGCTAQMKVAQTKSNVEKENQSSEPNSGTQTKMPDGVQAKMEGSLGADFSQVNIHSNSGKAQEMGALAFTQGDEVHFAKGAYNPETSEGQELLGHELTHVVQQRQGRVEATTQKNGLPVNDSSVLETEADVKGRKAANADQPEKTAIQTKQESVSQNLSNQPIQGFFGKIWNTWDPAFAAGAMTRNAGCFINGFAIFPVFYAFICRD